MKKKTIHLLSKSMLTKLALVTALFLGNVSLAVADELTVNGGASNTNKYLPIYVEGAATFCAKSEYIIPSNLLESVVGKKITKLSYEVSTKATATGVATYSVYLEEVSDNVYPQSGYDYLKTNSAVLVYTGGLNAKVDIMDVVFTSDFVYNGDGNLLVHIVCNSIGNEGVPYFRGKSDWTNYRGLYSGSTSANTRTGFVPKTTITYEEVTGQTNPKLLVTPNTIAFGSLRTNDTKTITVQNSGAGTMDVTIESDNTTDFTLSTTSLMGIGAGESKTFDVTFNYNAESLGEKTANITVTPSYSAGDAKHLGVTATAADAAVWEDFDSGIPSTWYNENGSWLNYVSGLSGYASPGYNSSHVLRTPRLYAEAGQTLGFDVKITGKYSSNKVTAKYSTDRVNWSAAVDYTADGSYTIEAPATGYYWVEFTASQAGIDNMTGWKIADAVHNTQFGKTTIPATGTAHGTYTSSVVVKELGGSAETINVELYFGDEKVAEQKNIVLNANRDMTIELSYLPTETFSGNVYVKVTGINISTLETDPVAVEITETPYVFDENSDVNPVISNNSVVKVKYTAIKGWNTIVMPFSLTGSPTYMNTIFGEGWTAYALDSFVDDKLTFINTTTYMATTTPFLVYAPNAESHPDGVYLQNVSAGSYNWGHDNINQTKGDATFRGTFAPIAAPGMQGKYGVTSDGRLAKGGNKANIKAYRAYIEVAEAAAARGLTLVIDNNGETTDLGFVKLVDQEAKAVYNLNGQRVEKGRKGLYIVNGKKVVVK